MDSLRDILAGKDFSPPDEVKAIKAYVAHNYGQDVTVALKANEIVVSSRSAALVSSLRLNGPALARAAGVSKRIRFKVG
jgi:hypothetical protein